MTKFLWRRVRDSQITNMISQCLQHETCNVRLLLGVAGNKFGRQMIV